jgi:hypothetical protein
MKLVGGERFAIGPRSALAGQGRRESRECVAEFDECRQILDVMAHRPVEREARGIRLQQGGEVLGPAIEDVLGHPAGIARKPFTFRENDPDNYEQFRAKSFARIGPKMPGIAVSTPVHSLIAAKF